MRTHLPGFGIAGLLSFAVAACAGTDEAGRGLAFVNENCATCHAVGPAGQSPIPDAPPFRTLHERYPVEFLAEALAEGIIAGHPDMPQFVLTPDEIDDVLAYLESIQTDGATD